MCSFKYVHTTGIEPITMSCNDKEINVTSNQTSEQYETEKISGNRFYNYLCKVIFIYNVYYIDYIYSFPGIFFLFTLIQYNIW